MKRIIRLTEGDLRRIIKESVNNFIKESDYMDDGDLEKQYDRNFDSKWNYDSDGNNYGYDCCYNFPNDPYYERKSGQGNKRNDNLASWDYFDTARDGADATMRRRLNNKAKHSWWTPSRNDVSKSNYLDGWNDEKKTYDTPMSSFKDRLDKQWKDTQDIEKYSKMADSRPLHRKSSLNRAFDESFQRKCNI